MPGFVLMWVVRRRRPHRRPGTQLELVLGTLVAALVVHLAFLGWTARLARLVDPSDRWRVHVPELLLFATALLLAALLLGGTLRLLHGALSPRALDGDTPWARGARVVGLRRVAAVAVDHDPPTAWDQMVQRLVGDGGWVVVRTRSGSILVGKFGIASRASFSPTEVTDLLLEEQWWPDELGNPVTPVVPRRQVWVSSSEIDSLQIIGAEEESA